MSKPTGGRPTGARDRLRNNFISVLADDFKENGIEALKSMRANDPSGYIRAIASLMPKEMDVSHKVSPLEQLTDEQLAAIVDATERFLGEHRGEATDNSQGVSQQAESVPAVH